MKFIKKSIVLLIFSILSGYSSIYPMEEEEEKTSVEIAYQLEQAFVQDQNQFEALIASLSPDNFIEHLAAIAEIIPLLENSDLITHICSTIVTAITQQEQNSELYNQAVKNMVPVVDFLIRKKQLQALTQVIVLYNADEQWAEVCNRIKSHISDLVEENAVRGYALKRKSDTSFYKKPETKKQKAEADAPPAVIPSLVALCASHVVNNIRSNRYEDNTFVNSFDFAQEAKLSEIEDSCLALLYKKSQKKNKKGFEQVVKWLNNLNLSAAQRETFKNYIINNSKAIHGLLIKVASTTYTPFRLPFYMHYGRGARERKGGSCIFGVLPSRSGKLLSAYSNVEGFNILDLKTGKIIFSKEDETPPFINNMSFSSDEKKIMSLNYLWDSAIIYLWDYQTGECIKSKTINIRNDNGETAHYRDILLIPDKKLVVLRFSSEIRLYDIKKDTYQVLPVAVNGQSNFLDVSSDEKKIIISTYTETKIYDIEGEISISLCSTPISGCVWSRDIIAYKEGDINKIFNLKTGQHYNLSSDQVLSNNIELLGISPNEKIIATTGDQKGAICLWDGQTGQYLRTIPGPDCNISEVVFCEDEKSFVSIPLLGGSVYYYNFINRQLVTNLDIVTLLWIEYVISTDLGIRLMEIYYHNKEMYEKLPDEIKTYLDDLK